MSFNLEHININNYEEYFILYMDNELLPHQVEMMEAFLVQNPGLRLELETLQEIKLPAENISFDKSHLYSSHIKSGLSEQDLLLYIDNELPLSRKAIVEEELSINPVFHQQFSNLMKARLDAGEQVAYPHKNELYRRSGRIISMAFIIRMAAAIILIASLAFVYFNNEKAEIPAVAVVPNKTIEKENSNTPSPRHPEPSTEIAENKILPVNKDEYKNDNIITVTKPQPTEDVQLVANVEVPDEVYIPVERSVSQKTIAINHPKQSFNKLAVTHAVAEPYNKITASIQPAVIVEDAAIANNNNKGSFKGILRKATRLFEKTTGIDPTNDEEELMIGVVSLNLK